MITIEEDLRIDMSLELDKEHNKDNTEKEELEEETLELLKMN